MKRCLPVLPLLALLVACTHRMETGLTEREAHEIVITLAESGIDARAEPDSSGKKENSLWQVTIRGDDAKAWKVLREHGLPHEKVQGLGEVFQNSGMIPTQTEEKAKLMLGLSGEMTRILQSVPSVVEAHVLVVLPDNSVLIEKKDQKATTASVLLRYRGEHSPLSDDEIRGLVAKGVEGLTPENVDVVQKQATEKPLPADNLGPLANFGPLAIKPWTTVAALALSVITSIGALSLLVVSKRRGFQIKMLERQIAQANEGLGRLGASQA